MNLGFCGIGKMGAAMVERLLDQGHRVTVWNRSPGKLAPLEARGAVAAASPAAVAAANDIVLTSLFDERAVADVFEGTGGLLSGDPRGRAFVEMSTLTPAFVRGLAG